MNGTFLNLATVQQEMFSVETYYCKGTDPFHFCVAVPLLRTCQNHTHLDSKKSNEFDGKKKNQL